MFLSYYIYKKVQTHIINNFNIKERERDSVCSSYNETTNSIIPNRELFNTEL